MSQLARSRLQSLAIGVGGLVVIGAVLGAGHGLNAALHLAISLPATGIVLLILLIPALYVGTSIFKAAPPAVFFVDAIADAARGLGWILLGSAPALGFLVATDAGWHFGFGISGLVLFAAFIVALRALFGKILGVQLGNWVRAAPVLLVWLSVVISLCTFAFVKLTSFMFV